LTENGIQTNWHTHTALCKHAAGNVADYCRAARRHGLRVLGFCDHTPLPDGRWIGVRMDLSQLPEYTADIDAARGAFPDLRIHAGLECEYIPEFASFYRDELCGAAGIEYLACGCHWYPWEGRWVGVYETVMDPAMLRAYTDYIIESMASGLFRFVAHPDLFGTAYLTWDAEAQACARAIIDAAVSFDIPLEINAYGLRKPPIETPEGVRPRYPWPPFWELAGELGATAIINSDAHSPNEIVAAMDACLALARGCGLPLVEDLFPGTRSETALKAETPADAAGP